MTDRGSNAANDRYILDLGIINLNGKGIYEFTIENLPEKNFVIGFKISHKNNNHNNKNNAELNITLSDSSGEKILGLDNSKLANWTWSSSRIDQNISFVYKRKVNYFTPIKKQKYNLQLEIILPSTSQNIEQTTLILKSGGWK